MLASVLAFLPLANAAW